jgi:peptide/nickel transport system permease protein
MILLSVMIIMAVGAPYWGTLDPLDLNPIERLRAPSAAHWFGTDMLGRDLYSRTIFGSRISLVVGVCVAGLGVGIGLAIGLLSGYHRLWMRW